MNHLLSDRPKIESWIAEVYDAASATIAEACQSELSLFASLAHQVIESARSGVFKHGAPPWLILPLAVANDVNAM